MSHLAAASLTRAFPIGAVLQCRLMHDNAYMARTMYEPGTRTGEAH